MDENYEVVGTVEYHHDGQPVQRLMRLAVYAVDPSHAIEAALRRASYALDRECQWTKRPKVYSI
jgi:hypothetical protein